jgi:hypothetical protein
MVKKPILTLPPFLVPSLVRACRAWWQLALVFSAWHAADVAKLSDPKGYFPIDHFT